MRASVNLLLMLFDHEEEMGGNVLLPTDGILGTALDEFVPRPTGLSIAIISAPHIRSQTYHPRSNARRT